MDKLIPAHEQTEERVRKVESSVRGLRVRQIIDEYTDNNQMPLYKINSSAQTGNEGEAINGSFELIKKTTQ